MGKLKPLITIQIALATLFIGSIVHATIRGQVSFAGRTFEGRSDRNENYWRLTAFWKAITKNGKIQFWQVYADSKIPYDIINKSKRQ
jgi:hypothetical protein